MYQKMVSKEMSDDTRMCVLEPPLCTIQRGLGKTNNPNYLILERKRHASDAQKTYFLFTIVEKNEKLTKKF